MHLYRTHSCSALRESDAGQTVRLSGWVHSKRDHGGLLFIDLRDQTGMTQIVIPSGTDLLDIVERLRVESVITVTGDVVAREEGQRNPHLPTGAIELRAREIEVRSHAAVLPFQVAGSENYPEDLRLKYRYLDLRREKMAANIRLRSAVIASMRSRMIGHGFTEFQTLSLLRLRLKARVTSSFLHACTPASSTPCRRLRSSSSSSLWWPVSTATSRSRPASATRPPALIVAPVSSISSISKWRSQRRKTCLPCSKTC